MEVLLKSLPILQKYMRHLTALVQELPVLYMLKEFMETEILHRHQYIYGCSTDNI